MSSPTIVLDLQAARDARRNFLRKAERATEESAKSAAQASAWQEHADEMGKVATYLTSEPGAVSVNYDESAAAYHAIGVLRSNGQLPTSRLEETS
jgi:uncharacterized protein YccT (UPF0319 family)